MESEISIHDRVAENMGLGDTAFKVEEEYIRLSESGVWVGIEHPSTIFSQKNFLSVSMEVLSESGEI